MKRLITFTIFSLIITLRMLAASSTVYMNVGDTRTLSFNAPSYLVSTQWTISDTKAVQFTSSPGSLSTSVTIKALEPRSASQRCIVHCKYYYRELDPVSGKYIYQRSGYNSWEVIITGSSQENTTVSFGITSLNVSEGRSVDILAYPSNDSYSGNYTWTSSNNNIMTVQDPVGNKISVKGVSPGTAYLRVTIDNGNYAELLVNVNALGGGSSCLSYTLIDGGAHYSVKCDPNKSCTGSITIPSYYNGKPVTEIAEKGFDSCDGMTAITIPNSVTSIGDYAFRGCRGLTSVTIPNSVISIGTEPFASCDKLTKISVDSGNKYYTDRDGVLYNKDLTTLIQCPGAKTSVTIPNSVTSIGDNAFYCCRGLTSVTIPNSVTSLGRSAFQGCSGMTSVTIPNSVTTIGESTFSGCRGLTSVTIPNSVTTISKSAFYGCGGLTSVTIPNSVTSIGGLAFYWCSGLTSVTIPNSVTSIFDGAFNSCSRLQSVYYAAENPIDGDSNIFSKGTYNAATLYLPEKAIAKAATVTPWSLFENVKAYDFSGIEEIEADINPELPCEIYNLKGVKIGNSTENLPAGIYILRQGATVKKIIVK